MKTLFPIIYSLFLFGCATATPYQPMGSDKSEGYRDLKLEENKYRILFKGNSLTPRETVETYILYRAAELTLDKGFDHFLVREQTVDVKSDYFNTGGPMYGMGLGRRRYPYYAVGYGWSGAGNVNSSDRYQAIAYITLLKGKGTHPDDAYDAKEVMKNLDPSIVRPKENKK